MAADEGLASAVMLVMLLGAVYLLLSERRPARGEDRPDWRDTDPDWSRAGFDNPRSDSVALRYERPRDEDADPLDFTPDIKGHVERLRDRVGVRTGNLGGVMRVEWHCRRFAMLVYRRLGRDPNKTSRLDVSRVADDLSKIRADIVNAVQAMYVSVYRARLQAEIEAASDGLLRDTAAYIRAVRKVTGSDRNNTYEAGRGFPSPWSESSDPSYDMLVP